MTKLSVGRPSPAMVLAVLALVFAMAGTAVAGPDAVSSKITKAKVKNIAKKQASKQLKANVPGSHVNLADKATTADSVGPNGVNTDAIQDNAVTTAKIADAAVTTAKIADSAVTTAKIANDSVNSAKVAPDSLTNADLAPGSVHASELGTANFVFGTSVAIANNAVVAAVANCPAGQRMLSGGALATGAAGMVMQENHPNTGNQWRVEYWNITGAAQTISPLVLCLQA